MPEPYQAGLGAMVLGNISHRLRREWKLVARDVGLEPWAKSELHMVCAKPALDIPRVRKVAELLADGLQRVRRR